MIKAVDPAQIPAINEIIFPHQLVVLVLLRDDDPLSASSL
jgi:hypothetical protein